MQRCNSSADSGVKTEEAAVDTMSTVALSTLRDHPYALNLTVAFASSIEPVFQTFNPQIVLKSHIFKIDGRLVGMRSRKRQKQKPSQT